MPARSFARKPCHGSDFQAEPAFDLACSVDRWDTHRDISVRFHADPRWISSIQLSHQQAPQGTGSVFDQHERPARHLAVSSPGHQAFCAT